MEKIELYASLKQMAEEWLINEEGERVALRGPPGSPWNETDGERTWVVGYVNAEAGGRYTQGDTFTRTPTRDYFPVLIKYSEGDNKVQIFSSAVRSVDRNFHGHP